MKNNGFTLAEVLITLGIIGVVASLTAPALTKNTGAAKIGPTLSKFVNTFETATEQMMNEEGISKLSDAYTASGSKTQLDVVLENLSNYLVMVPSDEKNYKFYAPGQNGVTNSGLTGKTIYILKDGSMLGPHNSPLGGPLPAKGSYKGTLGVLVYDINGLKGKNKAGTEVFAFHLDDSGVLIPFGGQAEKYLRETNFATCDRTNKGQAQYGLACTGQIADNNYKYEDK